MAIAGIERAIADRVAAHPRARLLEQLPGVGIINRLPPTTTRRHPLNRAPAGHAEATLVSSAAGSHPITSTSDQSLTGQPTATIQPATTTFDTERRRLDVPGVAGAFVYKDFVKEK